MNNEIFKPLELEYTDINDSYSIYEKQKIIDYVKKTYSITNFGRIFNMSRNKELKGYISNQGYKRVDISYTNKKDNIKFRKTFLLHKLIAKGFCSDSSESVKNNIIHHIDFNKLNNHFTNLCYLSQSEHIKIHKNNNKENI